MLTGLKAEAQRQEAATVQLTWLVAAVSGNKTTLESWHTGYGRERELKNAMPAHLHRALEVGIKLRKVSDGAFTTMRNLREGD